MSSEKKARKAAASYDRINYLKALQQITEDPSIRVSPRDYIRLARNADALGLPQAVAAIYQLGRSSHPNDQDLLIALLGHWAHSYDPGERKRAREEFAAMIGLRFDDGNVVVPNHIDEKRLKLLGMMLDTYHQDDLHEEALRITTAFIPKYPQRDMAVRNHARALENDGEEALAWYRKAISCPSPSGTSAV